MKNSSDFKPTDEFAAQYDDSAQRYGWHAPEVLFGLTYDRLEPGEQILDLGIGTGLSAVPFTKAGLRVFGLDGSREMLNRSAARDVAVDLKQHDIRSTPLPYPDDNFHHIISCGTFHLIGDLHTIFAEAARLIRGNGTFAFTTEELIPHSLADESINGDGVLEIENEASGVLSYRHSDALIRMLLLQNGFTTTKTLDFVAYGKTPWADERTFRAYVAVKKGLRSP